MKLFRFPDEFCADTRPYWILFAGFAISITLLVFTLYTRQPERYRGVWHLLAGESRMLGVTPQPEIQMAALAPAAENQGTAQSVVVPQVNTVFAPVPATIQFLGMVLDEAKPDPANRFPGDTPQKGIVVSSMPMGSLAYESGLRQGDLITSLNRQPVPTMLEFQRVASSLDLSQGLLFDVFRFGKPCYITMDTLNKLR